MVGGFIPESRATSSRNGGRFHSGMVGDIKSESWAASLGTCIELKSRRGNASKPQIKLRQEMLPVGVKWWLARSARAAMMALHLSGVTFRRKWKPPRLSPWEGPFADPTLRLPKHPMVAAEWRVAKRRYRLRRKLREREAAQRCQTENVDGGTAELSLSAPVASPGDPAGALAHAFARGRNGCSGPG
jgi:hypothetical protein